MPLEDRRGHFRMRYYISRAAMPGAMCMGLWQQGCVDGITWHWDNMALGRRQGCVDPNCRRNYMRGPRVRGSAGSCAGGERCGTTSGLDSREQWTTGAVLRG